ncbi:MAG: alpha/beta hydrolase [Chloroflexota bacterium]|nr:alpha/beta hydrolase [Chloroflexota bacterium]
MAEWSDHDAAINGLTIHYYRMGARNKPPVLLLHGYSDSGLAWTRLAHDLAPEYDLIMPDAVSHGRSSGPGPDGFRSRAVSDVVTLIEMLGLERPALVGHSMGARTAAGVAAEVGDHIRCAVLEDPPWRDTSSEPSRVSAGDTGRPSQSPIGTPRWLEWLADWKALTPDERAARVAEERPTWADEDRLPWAESKAQFNLDALNDPMASTPTPWREIVRTIICPVLLITADPERGGIVTPDVAHEAAALWRTGRVVQIANAGHNIRRDQYEPFRTAVTAFLRENV